MGRRGPDSMVTTFRLYGPNSPSLDAMSRARFFRGALQRRRLPTPRPRLSDILTALLASGGLPDIRISSINKGAKR